MGKPFAVSGSDPSSGLTEDDHDVIYDALDQYIEKYIQDLYSLEITRATMSLIKEKGLDGPISTEEATKASKKVIESGPLRSDIRKIKDKVSLIKAKMIDLKEKEKRNDLDSEIKSLLGE